MPLTLLPRATAASSSYANCTVGPPLAFFPSPRISQGAAEVALGSLSTDAAAGPADRCPLYPEGGESPKIAHAPMRALWLDSRPAAPPECAHAERRTASPFGH